MSRARLIPSLDAVLARDDAALLQREHGAHAAADALRAAADNLRADLLGGGAAELVTREDAAAVLVARARTALTTASRSQLQSVINATGIVIHTNLGRAPLGATAVAAVDALARGYVTLEFDLASGGRGSRHVHAERWLCELTGAEAAIVANNTAAAITVALAALASGREVIVSRGELVEIGGGFRIPEVMRASGAHLREVGTTNRTRVSDYAAALSDRTAALLRVHPSNFRIEGFTERPAASALADLARRFALPLLEDQGSGWLGLEVLDAGALPPDARRVLGREPSVRDSIAAGVDLVAFSGDKLLGGPQCGIVVGRAAPIAAIRKHPLMRAMRVDKMTYAALEATLRAWRRRRALLDVPVMAMIAASPDDLATRAARLVERLGAVGVRARTQPGHSAIGGGTTPGETLPTTLIAVEAPSGADALLANLRRGTPPVVARIADAGVCLDLRTVPVDMDDVVGEAVARFALH